jgi:hypothetical protein
MGQDVKEMFWIVEWWRVERGECYTALSVAKITPQRHSTSVPTSSEYRRNATDGGKPK